VRQKDESLPSAAQFSPFLHPGAPREGPAGTTIKPAWALVRRWEMVAQSSGSAWLPAGCLLAMGWQWLVGRETCCLLLVISYKERIWKLRCLHSTTRIWGRMTYMTKKYSYFFDTSSQNTVIFW